MREELGARERAGERGVEEVDDGAKESIAERDGRVGEEEDPAEGKVGGRGHGLCDGEDNDVDGEEEAGAGNVLREGLGLEERL
jgi:hypothetical protein